MLITSDSRKKILVSAQSFPRNAAYDHDYIPSFVQDGN